MNDDLEKSEAQQIALRHKVASETADASRAEQPRGPEPRKRPVVKAGVILLAVFGVGLLIFVAAPSLIALLLFLVYGFVPGR